MSGVRIVAGEFGGRRIRVPRVPGLRPTSERAREALFSILGHPLEGPVLDLYSGSGALGFEALSRGANPAVFVELDRGAVRALEQNAESLGVLDRCRFHQGRVLDQLARIRGEFSLILADPPYGGGERPDLLREIAVRCLLGPEGVLVIERDSRDPAAEPERGALKLVRTAQYGGSALDLYRS